MLIRTRQIAALTVAAGLTAALVGPQIAQAQTTPPAATAEIAEISVEHTACPGPCAVYKVTIKSDGTATFVGTANVDRLGTYTARIYEFPLLAEAVQSRNFPRLQDKYTSLRSDGGHIITTAIYVSGQRKVIDNYAYAGPQVLWEMQTLIDGAAAEARWQKASSPPAPTMQGC